MAKKTTKGGASEGKQEPPRRRRLKGARSQVTFVEDCEGNVLTAKNDGMGGEGEMGDQHGSNGPDSGDEPGDSGPNGGPGQGTNGEGGGPNNKPSEGPGEGGPSNDSGGVSGPAEGGAPPGGQQGPGNSSRYLQDTLCRIVRVEIGLKIGEDDEAQAVFDKLKEDMPDKVAFQKALDALEFSHLAVEEVSVDGFALEERESGSSEVSLVSGSNVSCIIDLSHIFVVFYD